MSNIQNDLFKKPKPMVQPVKVQNISGKPTVSVLNQVMPSAPNMPVTPKSQIVSPNIQSLPQPQISSVQRVQTRPTNQSQHGRINAHNTLPLQPRTNVQRPNMPNIPTSHNSVDNSVANSAVVQASEDKGTTGPIEQQPSRPLFSHGRSRMHPHERHNDTRAVTQDGAVLSPAERIRNNKPNGRPSPPFEQHLRQNNRPQLLNLANRINLIESHTVTGSTGIHVPATAAKMIVNAVAGGGAGGANNQSFGGGAGGAGASVNGLNIPVHAMRNNAVTITVGTGGVVGSDGTATTITGPNNNFSLVLGGGKSGHSAAESGGRGGNSGNVQFFSKVIVNEAINGSDSNINGVYNSGAAGGSGNAVGTAGADGGCSLFKCGLGDAISGAGGGGASGFATGGSGNVAGQMGSGGGGGANGGDGFATVEFYA